MTAGYVAWETSAWLMTWLASPSSQAFLWLEHNLTSQTQAVAVLSRLIPPQPVDTVQSSSHWISLHVARVLVFCAMTFSVFITFAIMLHLRSAIWDQNRTLAERNQPMTWAAGMVALLGGVYITLITMMFLTNVAWVGPLHAVAPLLGKSLSFHIYASLFTSP